MRGGTHSCAEVERMVTATAAECAFWCASYCKDINKVYEGKNRNDAPKI